MSSEKKMIPLWIVLAVIALLFLIAAKLLAVRALFRTRVLQWAQHRRDMVKAEALWVWRLALLLTLVIGVGEFLKAENPLLITVYRAPVIIGLALFALGLLTLLAAMDARKQYLWFFQVLAPKEDVPPFSINGIYGTVRNPRELGLILVLAGLAAAFSQWFTLAFTVLFLFATMYRVTARDRALIEKFGKTYIDYMRTSKKLIPYVY